MKLFLLLICAQFDSLDGWIWSGAPFEPMKGPFEGWCSCSFMVPTVLSHRLWETLWDLVRWLVLRSACGLHDRGAASSPCWPLFGLKGALHLILPCYAYLHRSNCDAPINCFLRSLPLLSVTFFCYCYNQVVDHAHQQKFLLLPFLTMWIAFFFCPYGSKIQQKFRTEAWWLVRLLSPRDVLFFLLVSSRKCLPRSVFAAHSRSHPCVHQAGVLWGAGAVLQPEAFGLVLAVMFGQRCGAASRATNWSIRWPMQMQHYGPTLYIDAPKKFHESESDNSEEFHCVCTSETRSII